MKRNRTKEKAIRAYRRHYDIGFIIGEMFYKQIERSKTHDHKKVEYTREQLISWAINQPVLFEIFEIWVKSGHIKELKPSIDRIDASKGYSFDNIQLLTWEENDRKGRAESKNKIRKIVYQYTKNGAFIREHESGRAASIAVAPHLKNHKKSKIYLVLNNKKNYNTFYGYKFKYKEDCH